MDLERDDLQGADDLAVKADERRMEMRRGKMIAVSLTVCAVGAGMTVNAYAASTTFEMRKKAVSLLGICIRGCLLKIPVFCGDPHGGDELLDVRLSRRKL